MPVYLSLLIACLFLLKSNALTTSAGPPQQAMTATLRNGLQIKLKETTLFSRFSHQEAGYGKSAFSFKHGLRSDEQKWESQARNRADLLYGNLTINRDSDWFTIGTGSESPSKIKDLGAQEWSDLNEVPVLLATLPSSSTIKVPHPSQSYEEVSEQRVTKAIAGHIYVIHIKSDEADYYAMFRVEKLAPNDNCTITWGLVPSPEKKHK